VKKGLIRAFLVCLPALALLMIALSWRLNEQPNIGSEFHGVEKSCPTLQSLGLRGNMTVPEGLMTLEKALTPETITLVESAAVNEFMIFSDGKCIVYSFDGEDYLRLCKDGRVAWQGEWIKDTRAADVMHYFDLMMNRVIDCKKREGL